MGRTEVILSRKEKDVVGGRGGMDFIAVSKYKKSCNKECGNELFSMILATAEQWAYNATKET